MYEAGLRLARRLRRWLLAPLMSELEQCKTLQREFNAEVKPLVVSLLDILKSVEPAHVETINTDLNMLEQMSAAASALKLFSESTFLPEAPASKHYDRLRALMSAGYARRGEHYDRWRLLREAVPPSASQEAAQRNSAGLISRLTFGYFGRGVEREVNAIHAEMAEMTILVRLMCEYAFVHQVSFKGVDFARIDGQIKHAVRMSEEALISMLVNACARPELSASSREFLS
jgi:hypothetical protein